MSSASPVAREMGADTSRQLPHRAGSLSGTGHSKCVRETEGQALVAACLGDGGGAVADLASSRRQSRRCSSASTSFAIVLGVIALPARAGKQLSLDVVLFIPCVMGGRVIPMFTNNGVPGAHATRHPLVEKLALPWQPWRTLLVWVLHLAYLWIPVHLAMRAAAVGGWIASSAAVHALTVGAVGDW